MGGSPITIWTHTFQSSKAIREKVPNMWSKAMMRILKRVLMMNLLIPHSFQIVHSQNELQVKISSNFQSYSRWQHSLLTATVRGFFRVPYLTWKHHEYLMLALVKLKHIEGYSLYELNLISHEQLKPLSNSAKYDVRDSRSIMCWIAHREDM